MATDLIKLLIIGWDLKSRKGTSQLKNVVWKVILLGSLVVDLESSVHLLNRNIYTRTVL